VPWGRSFQEYVRMFALTEKDLQLKILACADGPASFNCECSARGGSVISIDPIYDLSKKEIQKRIKETYEEVIGQTKKNQEIFKWDDISSVEELGRIRMAAMQLFLDSYELGKKEKRYISARLPSLPFEDKAFDIALSSHFLFLYTDNLSYDFHVAAIREMLRVAGEIRIFPLLEARGKKSSYVPRIMEKFQAKKIIIKKVNYEFQINGNEMLIIKNG
jgi:hypothetical protein